MPAAARGNDEVEPEMNQRSSAITARRKTRLVVRRGRIGTPDGVASVNLRGVGAKRDVVPVPVLCMRIRSADCGVRKKNVPVGAMFASLQDFLDELQVLEFFMIDICRCLRALGLGVQDLQRSSYRQIRCLL